MMILAKALELFLGLIIDESHKVTSNRGSKKVEAYHLYVTNSPYIVFFLKYQSPILRLF